MTLYVFGGSLELLNEYLETNYKEGDIKEYYLQDVVPEEKRLEFCKYLIDNSIYKHASLIDDAKEVIENLNDKYDIYICSAFLVKGAENYCSKLCKDKFDWLQEKLPFIHPEKYIFCNNKSVIKAEIKIDDRISNLQGDCMKILFDAYHNRAILDENLKKKDIIRARSWKEIEIMLL